MESGSIDMNTFDRQTSILKLSKSNRCIFHQSSLAPIDSYNIIME
jgi:hypothetical protein